MCTVITPSLYGIIGYPLGHTLSPLIHNTAFRELGIPAVYIPWPTKPEQLSTLVDAVRLLNIRGLSVTIPHKTNLIPLVDRVTDRVKALGAANTVYWDGEALCADNTDIMGFLSPLQKGPLPADTKALLLGAGGAARAAVAGLKMLGLKDIVVTDIVEDLPAKLAEDFDLKVIPWNERTGVKATLIVNTTPLGMKGKFEGDTGYPAEAFAGRSGIAYDVVYTPFLTRFQKDAAAAGWKTIPGREMFVMQADHQFHTWTGHHLPEAAKQAVFNALNAV